MDGNRLSSSVPGVCVYFSASRLVSVKTIEFDMVLEGNFPPIGAISGVFVLPGIPSLPVLDVLGPIPV